MIFRKITAFILSLTMAFSASSISPATLEEKEIKNFAEYKEYLDENGCAAVTTEEYVGIMNAINKVFRILIGRGNTPPEHFNFVVDDMLREICVDIADRSGFDMLLFATTLPESNQFAKLVVETFQIDTDLLYREFYAIRDKYYNEGNMAAGAIFHFIALYFSVIEECRAYCIPAEQFGENCYEICLALVLKDGSEDVNYTGIIINSETGQVTGKNNKGIVDIGYNFSIPELLVYVPVNVWMRDFGFCLAYDLFSYATPLFFYETRRFKFEYDGLEWMIQVWKGNYLISNGAEIGIYSREKGSFGTYYDCADDEQMLEMSMQLYHGEDLLFERAPELHWWMTGFQISNTLYTANSMTLKFSMTMKDEEMLNAFCESVDRHYRHDVFYTVDGLNVNIVW